MRVLVIEDEPLIAEVVARGLAREGLAVQIVGDGDRALEVLGAERYDLMVLDLMLPGRDGLDVCREIRRVDARTPILMLTARDALEEKVRGLDSGADDYVTKPFELAELLARVRSLLRRARPMDAVCIDLGGLVLTSAAREIHFQARPVPLTDTEFRLLEHLMRNPDKGCRRHELLEHVWGYRFDPGSNVVDVFVRRLRHKLETAGCPQRIETVRGIGYRLRK